MSYREVQEWVQSGTGADVLLERGLAIFGSEWGSLFGVWISVSIVTRGLFSGDFRVDHRTVMGGKHLVSCNVEFLLTKKR